MARAAIFACSDAITAHIYGGGDGVDTDGSEFTWKIGR